MTSAPQIQYAGGLSCCGHRRIMLDADQEVRPELLQYHMKFRSLYVCTNTLMSHTMSVVC